MFYKIIYIDDMCVNILEVIKEYLPSEPKCLEIFARYLLPGWTSWGLEVLKFQDLSLYTILEHIKNNKDATESVD